MIKAKRMIDDAASAGAECVKFQSHVIDDEMVPAAQQVIPGNASVSIYEIMKRCAFSAGQERELKKYTESKGLLYLSTPFSRAAAERLRRMNVTAYKIGSGECNNFPLIEHIATFGKPVILSTGMNDVRTVARAVAILRAHKIPFALLQCTSIYPTPYDKVHLGALAELQHHFREAVIGLSDHSLGNYVCFAACALGASLFEKHFTSDKKWKGPDISLSINTSELKDLIFGLNAIHASLGGDKEILPEERPTIDFAYACVVAISDIKPGEKLSMQNIWVKRPGTGDIKADSFKSILGKRTTRFIKRNEQIKWNDLATI